MNEDIMVSVICITYNHEKYIQNALNGFDMQKTDFKYEIIIHDDASTDNTRDILIEYKNKHDNVVLILQDENQYSQGCNITKRFVYPIVKGKFVAFCEGDDYWTDENKLQTLYNYMINHDTCAMCCHAYNEIESESRRYIQTIKTRDSDGILSMPVLIGYKNPTQLASQMFRFDCVKNLPTLFLNRGIGDYTLLLYAATKGEIYFINKIMANKRIASENSWTNRVYKSYSGRIKHDLNMIEFLNDFNDYTNKKYDNKIQERIAEFDFDVFFVKNEFKKMLYHRYFPEVRWKKKTWILLGCICPQLARYIKTLHK